jgi:integrase/recombinase XerC
MLSRDIEQYLEYAASVRRLSPHTVSNYQRDLNKLLSYCDTKGIKKSDDILTADVRDFIAQQHRQGLSGTTIQRLLSAVRSLFNFLNRSRTNKRNPALDVRAPKTAQRLPTAADVDEIQQFLEIDTDDILACRDAAMFELLYSSGLRLSELVKLNLKDMDLKARMLTVTGKGNKTRELPIGKKAVSAVKDWLKRRDEFVRIENDAVFLSKRGTRISPRSVQARLEYWSKQQAMGHKLHPHMLRHSFASHLLQSSGDLRALQELLGHSNITTTQVYTHLDYQHLAKVYDNAHPRAKLKK